jgi:hypothetical protein
MQLGRPICGTLWQAAVAIPCPAGIIPHAGGPQKW